MTGPDRRESNNLIANFPIQKLMFPRALLLLHRRFGVAAVYLVQMIDRRPP
jgi:hypothetical protein